MYVFETLQASYPGETPKCDVSKPRHSLVLLPFPEFPSLFRHLQPQFVFLYLHTVIFLHLNEYEPLIQSNNFPCISESHSIQESKVPSLNSW